MFQIDDNFLASVGYNVDTLSEDKKQQYITEMTEELNQRASERLVRELSEEQAEDMNRMQDSPERARAWLEEFHSDYQSRGDYQQLLAHAPSEDEAVVYYASSLWMNHAVPNYGELLQDEMNAYHAQLVKMRQAASAASDR